MFQLAKYIEPDFTEERFVNAPNCQLVLAPHAKAAPKGFHATSIFPEYFKINGQWYLAKDSRMDAVPVWSAGFSVPRSPFFGDRKSTRLNSSHS